MGKTGGPMSSRFHIVIVGCGRLGARLANRLSRQGHYVIVIDSSAEAFSALSADFSGFRIEGDASRLGILREAKLGQADLVVVMSRDDNVNLMVAQVAKLVFEVANVLVRVIDPDREELAAHYHRLGIRTLCPTQVAAERFLLAIDEMAVGEQGRHA